jgi:hypothetical protein
MKHNDPYQQLAKNCASADGGTAVLPKKVKN